MPKPLLLTESRKQMSHRFAVSLGILSPLQPRLSLTPKSKSRLLRPLSNAPLSHPELVLGAPVQVLDGARELVAVVARLEAVSLRHKTKMTKRSLKTNNKKRERAKSRATRWANKKEKNNFRRK